VTASSDDPYSYEFDAIDWKIKHTFGVGLPSAQGIISNITS
jgi:hypothetical protein